MKNIGNKWRAPAAAVALLCAAQAPAFGAEQAPRPNLSLQDNKLTVQLAYGGAQYQADWWMLASTSAGQWYYYVYPNQWVSAGNSANLAKPAYQGGVIAVNPLAISTTGLPDGVYTFYFGVDLKKNGVLDIDPNSLFYHSLVLKLPTSGPNLINALTGYFQQTSVADTIVTQTSHTVSIGLYNDNTWKSVDNVYTASSDGKSSNKTYTDNGRYTSTFYVDGSILIIDDQWYSDPLHNTTTVASNAKARFYAVLPGNSANASDMLWKTDTETYFTSQGICYQVIGTLNDYSVSNHYRMDACSFTIK